MPCVAVNRLALSTHRSPIGRPARSASQQLHARPCAAVLGVDCPSYKRVYPPNSATGSLCSDPMEYRASKPFVVPATSHPRGVSGSSSVQAAASRPSSASVHRQAFFSSVARSFYPSLQVPRSCPPDIAACHSPTASETGCFRRTCHSTSSSNPFILRIHSSCLSMAARIFAMDLPPHESTWEPRGCAGFSHC